MTTLFHMIQKASWSELEKYTEKKNRENFRDTFMILRKKNPVPNTEKVLIQFDEKGYCTVTAGGKAYDTTESLLNQWLGYVIEAPPSWSTEKTIGAVFTKIKEDRWELAKATDKLRAEFAKFN